MSTALKLLLRVLRRRIQRGETVEAALADYPKLTDAERTLLLEVLR